MIDPILSRRDIGYTLISRFEELFRSFLVSEILAQFERFEEAIPTGILEKVNERMDTEVGEDVSEFLDNTDFPDLTEICCYRNRFPSYFPQSAFDRRTFEQTMVDLYLLRNKIAHVRQHFNAFDLDKLVAGTSLISRGMEAYGRSYLEFVEGLKSDPGKFVVKMPVGFTTDQADELGIPNNLPVPDYEHEGGFVGRKEDVQKLTSLLLGSSNVITISGAGGVGKTALALRVVQLIVQKPEQPFDAVVWLSAKETKLSYLGIEDIEPTIRNYEELLDTIFSVAGFDRPRQSLPEKEEDITVIFELLKRTLIIIDNLETITDDRITNFILDIEDRVGRQNSVNQEKAQEQTIFAGLPRRLGGW